MIRFDSDYIEGAHPSILEALAASNFEQHVGYGCDDYCERARDIIRSHCKDNTVGVQFLVGGTQANVTVIDALLYSYQGVISADSGHINVHETGAPEATGHKVIALPSADGRLSLEQIKECYFNQWNDHSHEHTVQPGMVYLADAAREYFRRPGRVVSGLRCPEWNRIQKGTANSQHMYGEAVDLRIDGVSSADLLAFINRQPGVRYAYAINSTNVHIGIPYGKR